MKYKINNYSSSKLSLFLDQVFVNYEIKHKTLSDLNNLKSESDYNLVFLTKHDANTNINFDSFDDSFTLITKNNLLTKINANLDILISPIKPRSLITHVRERLAKKTKIFKNIQILEKKIINLSSGKQASLTEIEKEILSYIFKNKACYRFFIKENILKIKSNIETNSLDSHLTRIRKKLEAIKSDIKIITKDEKLILVSN